METSNWGHMFHSIMRVIDRERPVRKIRVESSGKSTELNERFLSTHGEYIMSGAVIRECNECNLQARIACHDCGFYQLGMQMEVCFCS